MSLIQNVKDDALLVRQPVSYIRYLVEKGSHSKKVASAFREVENRLIQYSPSQYTVLLIQKQSTIDQRYISWMNPFDADLNKAKAFARLETAILKDVTDE